MSKITKLLSTSLTVATFVVFASICASAAQMESFSIVDNTVYASVDAENVRLYVADYNDGLLGDVFFSDFDANGNVELPVGSASEYALFLWDRNSLAPVSCVYNVVDNRACPSGDTTPVPEYAFSDYTFNQDSNVMVVSSVTQSTISLFSANNEVSYNLASNVTVLGLSDDLADVVPGSVVLVAENRHGECAAIELLASLGIPVDPSNFENDYGVYSPSDGSEKYQNILIKAFSKSRLTLKSSPDKAYYFRAATTPCYKVTIDTSAAVPVVTYEKKSAGESIFESTAKFNNYCYLRFDTTDQKIVECVYYSVKKDFDPGKGDGEYTDIFSLK